jgi:addiction module RelE/StbE family toxin
MTIKYSKQFKKQFKKLKPKEQDQFWSRLEWFKDDIFDPRLGNHALKGKMMGLRSIDISGDLRALYEVIDDEVYLYQLIGTHSQLYG